MAESRFQHLEKPPSYLSPVCPNVLNCSAHCLSPFPRLGGEEEAVRDRGRWPQAVSMAAGPSSCPSLLFSWAGKSVQQRTHSPTQNEVKSPDHRVEGSLPSNST